MKKTFSYEFEDESDRSRMSFEYDEEIEEKISVIVEDGIPVIYGNKQAYLFLAKVFCKLSLGNYESGFHLHLNMDLGGDEPEILRVILDDE